MKTRSRAWILQVGVRTEILQHWDFKRTTSSVKQCLRKQGPPRKRAGEERGVCQFWLWVEEKGFLEEFLSISMPSYELRSKTQATCVVQNPPTQMSKVVPEWTLSSNWQVQTRVLSGELSFKPNHKECP